MNSIEFIKLRALRTRDAQNALATVIAPAVPWVWSQKTVAQWDADITGLDQLVIDESLKQTQLRSATAFWQADVDAIYKITQDIAGIGRVKFRKDPVKLALIEALSTDSKARAEVYGNGLNARDAWVQADPAWSFDPDVTTASLGSLLTSCLARQAAHSSKITDWRETAAMLNLKAQLLDEDNVAWYEEATRRFPAGTAEGDMIRTTVPTTTQPTQPVEQAEILNPMASGGDIHLDAQAEHATRYTFLQQTPGSPAFVVVLADSPDGHLTLHNQVPGVHRFKAVGRNSDGEGPESAIVEVTVAQSAVA
jgi:hypothetical protein